MLTQRSKSSESGPYIEKVFLKSRSGEISRSRAGVMGTDFQNGTFPIFPNRQTTSKIIIVNAPLLHFD
jgi:hypothetical protein